MYGYTIVLNFLTMFKNDVNEIIKKKRIKINKKVYIDWNNNYSEEMNFLGHNAAWVYLLLPEC